MVPDNIWKSLTSEQRKVILDHNGEKERERKRERDRNWSSQGQETKRLQRTIMDILEQSIEVNKGNEERNPNSGESKTGSEKITPKLTFKIKRG